MTERTERKEEERRGFIRTFTQLCHLDRSVAEWRDLRFIFKIRIISLRKANRKERARYEKNPKS